MDPGTQRRPDAFDEAQARQLTGLLTLAAREHDGMTLEGVDGLFCALIVTPDPVGIDEYLPLIRGSAPPWDSEDEAEEYIGLLMAFWNHVAERIRLDPRAKAAEVTIDGPEAREATGFESRTEAEVPIGAAWAEGFMAGLQLREEAWVGREEADAELAVDLGAIAWLLAPDPDDAEDLVYPTMAERLALVDDLPFVVHGLNLARLDALVDRTPARRAPLPGRNDPCLCGSGRKYKKCCGAAGVH